MVTTCPVENGGCERVTIVVMDVVGACEGCEDSSVKGSASVVSILLLGGGLSMGLPIRAGSLRKGAVNCESRRVNGIIKWPTYFFVHHLSMATWGTFPIPLLVYRRDGDARRQKEG